MIGKLDRYVARMFFTSWLVSAVFFVGLFGIVDFFSNVEQLLHSVKHADVGLATIGRFYLLKAPGILVAVAPFIMLIAALFTVLRLQRHNELMAMQLTGRRSLRVLSPVFGMTVLFMGLIVWVQEVAAPRLSVEREQLEARLIQGYEDWVIDHILMKDARGWLMTVRNYRVATETIGHLDVSGRDASGNNRRIEGEQATWDGASGGWRLTNGRTETRARGAAAPEISEAAFFPTDIRPEDLLVDYREPFDLSYREVLERSERYPNAASFRLLRHYHITYPLSVLMLVVLGVPFVLRRQPKNSLVGLGISLLLCLTFLIVDLVVRDLGNRGFLQPVLAAWVPVILAGSLGVVLFDSIDS